MKRKTRSLIALAAALAVTAAATPTVFAATAPTVQPRYSYINSASADLVDNEDDTASFSVDCEGVTAVESIDMEVILQKKGLLGIYTKVDEDSKTVNKSYGSFNGEFDIDSSETYRIKFKYTVYTANDEESDSMFSDPTD